MSTAVQVESAAKPKEPEYKPQTKVSAAFFVDSVPFGGECMGVSIGRNVDSIAPARLEGDGTIKTVEANQRADGIVIRRKHSDLNTHARVVMQTFVPWSNVRSISYGE